MQEVGDVVAFDAATIVAESITEQAEHVGTRIRLTARMGNVRQRIQIDFGVGDSVVPAPLAIEFPLLLGGAPIRLAAYPAEAAIAEKFHVMVVRDTRNSRMKDFYDVWMLSKNCSFHAPILRAAILATFGRRGTPVPEAVPVALTNEFYASPSQSAQWSAFTRRIGETELAGQFPLVVEAVRTFIMPALCDPSVEHINPFWPAGGPWSKGS